MFERFITLREKSGLSQEELAKQLDIRKEIVESIENGYNAPIHVLVAYAKYFHVSSDYILGLADEENGDWTLPVMEGDEEVMWFIADENEKVLAETLKSKAEGKAAIDELTAHVSPGKYIIGFTTKDGKTSILRNEQ